MVFLIDYMVLCDLSYVEKTHTQSKNNMIIFILVD
nr:MAG TPA: hypothetical protein [Caudoviricetes sp.]DAS25721.1 MAG TPA: hypothetical protein [Caudoviricetes sp.]